MFFFPPKEEPLDHFWTHLYIFKGRGEIYCRLFGSFI